jgi:hypothetical protein
VTRYLILLRGINVGGRNKLPMAALRELLESHGHTKVSTYIASGNVILSSDRSAAAIKRELEEALPKTFKLDSELVAVLAAVGKAQVEVASGDIQGARARDGVTRIGTVRHVLAGVIERQRDRGTQYGDGLGDRVAVRIIKQRPVRVLALHRQTEQRA